MNGKKFSITREMGAILFQLIKEKIIFLYSTFAKSSGRWKFIRLYPTRRNPTRRKEVNLDTENLIYDL